MPRKSDVEDDTTATTMEAKPKTIEERITKFIVKELPQTEGDPNYVGINKMIQGLYGNVAILPTTLGGEGETGMSDLSQRKRSMQPSCRQRG